MSPFTTSSRTFNTARNRFWRYGGVLLVIGLIAFRLFLPTLIKSRVNRILNEIPGYRGHIDGIGIHLWRGAYSIDGLKLVKTNGRIPVPFVSLRAIDFSIAWKPLFHGNLSGKVELDEPQLNFVAGGSPEQQQTSIDKSWKDRVKELLPLRMARVGIKNGEVHFRNYQADPPIDIYVHRIFLVATNLTNSLKFTNTLKATIEGQALAMSDGKVDTRIVTDPLGAQPTFTMTFELKNLSLPQLNDFFRHYLAVNMRMGTLSLYMEGAADNGRFVGYVKPLLENADLVKIKQNPSLGEAFKGLGVKLTAYLMKNHPKDRLATRIEMKGTLDHPEVNVAAAVFSFLRNWLIKAIPPGLDKAVRLEDARTQEVPRPPGH